MGFWTFLLGHKTQGNHDSPGLTQACANPVAELAPSLQGSCWDGDAPATPLLCRRAVVLSRAGTEIKTCPHTYIHTDIWLWQRVDIAWTASACVAEMWYF